MIINDFIIKLIGCGFFLTLLLGMLATWLDRKISARLQYRVGPPWFQPMADLLKWLGKETIVPEGVATWMFLGAPLFGLAAAIVSATILWSVNLQPETAFLGDLIVVVYLLTIPSLAIIIGGSASRNPLAAIGASREMKLILAYELAFIIATFTVVAKTGSILFSEIIKFQAIHGLTVMSWSGLVAFVVALLVMQAKLGQVPFDIAEAEQEIASGPLLEYSGPPLAIYKITRSMLFFVLPLFLITLFLGGIHFTNWLGLFWFMVKYAGVLTVMILLKNTNPRLRIDQALRFFWGPVTVLAIIGFILVLVGW